MVVSSLELALVVVGVFVRVTISWLFMRRKTTNLVFNVLLFFKGHFMLSYSSLFFEVSLLKKKFGFHIILKQEVQC